jgi:hypothetical protein
MKRKLITAISIGFIAIISILILTSAALKIRGANDVIPTSSAAEVEICKYEDGKKSGESAYYYDSEAVELLKDIFRGKYVTDKSGNDISHLGIFVSTGAVGLVLGQRFLDLLPLSYILFSILIICGLLVIFSCASETRAYSEIFERKDKSMLALLAVVGVVVIRSFVGKVASPDFDPSRDVLLIIAIGTALGKAMGGICSKLFGVRVTVCVSLVVSAICLTLGAGNIVLYTLGVFAFNFSMPITLYYANILLKGSEGFAFGTLAAALAPGFFVASCFTYSIPMRICTAILCVVSIIIIVIISKKIKKYDTSLNSDNNY